MEVQLRPLSSIRPYDNNPRINDLGVDAVAASIQAFGFRPHALQSGAQARPQRGTGPCGRRFVSGPGQGIPPFG